MNIVEYLKEWGSEKDVIECINAWGGTLFSVASDESMSAIVNSTNGGDCWFAEFDNGTRVYYDFADSEGDFYRFHTLNDRRMCMASKLAVALFGTECKFRFFIFDSGVETHYFKASDPSVLYAIHFLIRPYMGYFKIGAGRSGFIGGASGKRVCDGLIAKRMRKGVIAQFHMELPIIMGNECTLLHECLSLVDGTSRAFEVRFRAHRINLAFFYDFLNAVCFFVKSFRCQYAFEGWDEVVELPEDADLDGFLLDDLVDPFDTGVLDNSTAEALVQYEEHGSVFRVCLVTVFNVPYNYLICVDKTRSWG